jgi:predicted nucleotidyltransferase component of viral defense system
MRKPLRNIGASVRARLLSLAKERNQPFDLLLTRYVLERLLYRLSETRHRDQFALKGAILMTTWFDDPLRPTRDLDLLGFGAADPRAMIGVFREICAVEADDGVRFDAGSVTLDHFRERQEYGGFRTKIAATVDGARVRAFIDIGFGDAIEPGLVEIELPVLLDLPAPRLRTYSRETVIAEKFHAMVLLGLANTRMKDFYDIWALTRSYDFTGDRLARAIAATFARRKTAIPRETPEALTQAFVQQPGKLEQWAEFVAEVGGERPSLNAVIDDLAAFLMRHAAAA